MKKPAKTIRLRFRKNDTSHNLQAAAQHFLLAHGGTAVLIGSIEVIQMPGDPLSKYRISVTCFGIKPSKQKEASNE